jgi:integrase
MPAKYICRDRGMVYFRKRGCPKVRIREPYGSPEFWQRYAELLAKAKSGELKTPPRDAPQAGTWRWLCVEFFKSETGLLALDPGTQTVRRQVLEATCQEPIEPDSPRKFGECPLTHFTEESVRIMRTRKKDYPEAANVRLKAISRVYKWAFEELSTQTRKLYGIVDNPVRNVARLKPKNPGGFHTWTVEEIERYEQRHPSGTKAYLAMQLFIYCGGRRADVVALGRQHTRNGRLRYTQNKNSRRKPVVVDIAMHAELQKVIDASQAAGITGDLTFLVTEYGRPFRAAGFGNKLAEWCKQAKVPGRGHGLRKAAAVRVAENGGTVDQLKAIFGWVTNQQPELYVREANRRRLGSAAPDLLAPPRKTAEGRRNVSQDSAESVSQGQQAIDIAPK